MRIGTSRLSALRAVLALATLALYTAGVAVLPAAHGSTESVQSDRSFEAEHSDECPTLHAGAVCTTLSGLGNGQPGRSHGGIRAFVAVAAAEANPADDAAATPPLRRTAARAPPHV